MFKPTRRSIKSHKVPEWFHNAKLGIFIHWGLYSVPAFAEVQNKSYHKLIQEEGIGAQFAHNPYAEWYQNSLRIEGTKTQEYHQKEYGPDFKYEDFAPLFNEEIKKWDPEEMASIFEQAGAKYVVLVTKHHDGFTMWPSDHPNPNIKNYHASRDIVGELTQAVNKRKMRMALYYSGKIDWSFDKNFIEDVPSMVDNEPRQPEYPKYADNHYYELIDKYEPWILWNDIGYPKKGKKLEIFAYYFNNKHNGEGLINNRWTSIGPFGRWLIRRPLIAKIVNNIANRFVSNDKKDSSKSREIHIPLYDFSTPEYQTESKIKKYKWESCRGLGSSFGYNRLEMEEDYLSSKELIHQLIDVVSKNGNLLINVGPKPDGTITEIQKKLILDLGAWLKINGEAIYGTRPWNIPETKTKCGIPIRFTAKKSAIFMVLLEKPKQASIIIENIEFPDISGIKLIGSDSEVKWATVENTLVIELPSIPSENHAYTFKISY